MIILSILRRVLDLTWALKKRLILKVWRRIVMLIKFRFRKPLLVIQGTRKGGVSG
jgi:hypothetical protein